MKANNWLDEMVDAAEKLLKTALKDDRYDAFGVRQRHREFQLSIKGLEHLAHDMGAIITYDSNWHEAYPEMGEEYFMYRGYKVFALWEKKGVKK